MTLGQLKFRLLRQFTGLDIDLLEGFISDRYSEILQELPWSRLSTMAVLRTAAPYAAGTAAVTAGSAIVTLAGGAWTADMTGRAFRVVSRDEYYEFAFSGANAGTLDRGFEGDTAAAAAYSIYQSVYPLPADCRLLADDAFAPLQRLTREQLGGSTAVGMPTAWASYMDDGSTPPCMQVELSPIPNSATGLPFEYTAEVATPGASGAAFVPWLEPATALVEGVIGKILRTPAFKDLAGAQLAMVEAAKALSVMRNVEAQRLPPTQMQLGSYFTSHRRRRY